MGTSDRVNLLEETKACLARNGKTEADVIGVKAIENFYRAADKQDVFVGTWAEFAALADFTYDCGYGGANINTHLQVIGKDWWLERGEYDGSEWWEFKTQPTIEYAQALTAEAITSRY